MKKHSRKLTNLKDPYQYALAKQNELCCLNHFRTKRYIYRAFSKIKDGPQIYGAWKDLESYDKSILAIALGYIGMTDFCMEHSIKPRNFGPVPRIDFWLAEIDLGVEVKNKMHHRRVGNQIEKYKDGLRAPVFLASHLGSHGVSFSELLDFIKIRTGIKAGIINEAKAMFSNNNNQDIISTSRSNFIERFGPITWEHGPYEWW